MSKSPDKKADPLVSSPLEETKKPRSLYRDAYDLISLTVGIYVCYLGYGLVQETIYKTPFDGDKFNFSLFLVCCQCLINGTLAAIMCTVKGTGLRGKVPQSEFVKIACSYIGAMFCSNYSLNFISYPTQALAKSCKMIPVMLSRIVINGKSYKLQEYLTVMLITAGISVFMLNNPVKSKKESATSMFGLFLLFTSLLLDGFTGPTQENIINKYKPTPDQVMVWMNVYAVCICTVFLVASGELFSAIAFITTHPAILPYLALFCLLSAVGQKVVMMTLFRFDSLVLTMITTTRKFFTILCSVVVHGSILNGPQWGGVAMVFAGVCADVFYKTQAKKEKAASKGE